MGSGVPLTDVYRFLARPAWLGAFALCVAVSVAFVFLGNWQLDRLDQRRARNAAVAAARTAAPTAVERTLSTTVPVPHRLEYAQVSAVGRYDAADEALVRSRTQDGRNGLLVLTPLVRADGTAVLVVRGWVPASVRGADVAPDVPAPPTGEVRVVGRIREPESGGGAPVEVDGQRQVRRIDPVRFARTSGHPTYLAYVELVEQTPPVTAGPALVPAPDDLDEGPHLAYAVQWYLFAGMLYVGFGALARTRARRPDDAPDPRVGAPGPVAGTPVAASRPT